MKTRDSKIDDLRCARVRCGYRLAIVLCALGSTLALAPAGRAVASDFYELQIYTNETVPQGHLMPEVHSNYVFAAQGSGREELPVYQYHNTLEVTYGVLPWLEVGQYLCTGDLGGGHYEYAGARSKVHFSIPQTKDWPVSFGGNLEFQYMRRAAVDDPLNLEFMPIVQGSIEGFFLVADLGFEKQFSGPGTHDGIGFGPAAAITYRMPGEMNWFEPALEYYAEYGPLTNIYGFNRQQDFIVPGFNLYLNPHLEFNFGVGVGLPGTLQGQFVKGTIGWVL